LFQIVFRYFRELCLQSEESDERGVRSNQGKEKETKSEEVSYLKAIIIFFFLSKCPLNLCLESLKLETTCFQFSFLTEPKAFQISLL
jgi:hypothetical protein